MSFSILYVGKRISRDLYRWQLALRRCWHGSSWAALYIVCMYLYLYVCMYICIECGVYIYIRIHAHAHTHTHTHTHTYKSIFIRGSRLSGGAGAGVRGALCKTRVSLDEPTWGVNEAVERMRVPSTLQHAATRCNTLQHAATRCNMPEHSALCYSA